MGGARERGSKGGGWKDAGGKNGRFCLCQRVERESENIREEE